MVQLGQESGPRSSCFLIIVTKTASEVLKNKMSWWLGGEESIKDVQRLLQKKKKIEHEGMTYGAGEF